MLQDNNHHYAAPARSLNFGSWYRVEGEGTIHVRVESDTCEGAAYVHDRFAALGIHKSPGRVSDSEAKIPVYWYEGPYKGDVAAYIFVARGGAGVIPTL